MRSLKTINYWMFAAMFILCGATMSLSSCSDSDDTVQQTEDAIQKLALKNMLVKRGRMALVALRLLWVQMMSLFGI